MNPEKATTALMEALAKGIDEILRETAGERLGFVLIVAGVEDNLKTNFISNVSRKDSVPMLRSTADRLEVNETDDA